MLDFLKRFGLGILYVLISPFVITFLLLWALYNIGIFLVELTNCFINFFKGKKFFAPFPEDVEAKRILSLEPYNNMNVAETPVNSNPQSINPPNNNQWGLPS